jgi:oligoribonuclease
VANPVIWLDLETTGLNPEDDLILEVGMVATNDRFERFEDLGDFHMVIQPSGLDVTRLNKYVVEMHSKNGLFTDIAAERGYPLSSAQKSVESWLRTVRNRWLNTDGIDESVNTKLLMAGSSVGQFDRQFFERDFPGAMEFFDYRVIDVSSVKEVVRRVYGDDATYSNRDASNDGVQIKAHRVLPDIECSIAELRFYLNAYFKEAK